MIWTSVTSRFAYRSLGRNRRRTALSVLGIAVGCAIGLITIGWIRGEREMIIRAAAESGAGHVRIAPTGWQERRDMDLRLEDGPGALASARQVDGLRVAAPRARARALLAMGTRVASVELTGVDPEAEQQSLRFVRQVAQGHYLTLDETGTIVVGRALAEQLDSTIEDELVATAVDQEGEMRSIVLRIIGIVESGSREIDRMLAHVRIPDVEGLTGLQGTSEVTLLLNDARRLEDVRTALAAQTNGDQVLTWYEVAPELRAGLSIDEAFADISVLIVLLVVLLGVASAQLTGVLERRREFAVLSALGMRAGQMIRLVLTESLVLGAAASFTALLLALPALYYLSTEGVDFSAMTEDSGFALGGVLLDPVMYADLGMWIVPYAIVLSTTSTFVASVYPAIFAAMTDPATALRVAQ